MVREITSITRQFFIRRSSHKRQFLCYRKISWAVPKKYTTIVGVAMCNSGYAEDLTRSTQHLSSDFVVLSWISDLDDDSWCVIGFTCSNFQVVITVIARSLGELQVSSDPYR